MTGRRRRDPVRPYPDPVLDRDRGAGAGTPFCDRCGRFVAGTTRCFFCCRRVCSRCDLEHREEECLEALRREIEAG